MYCAGHRALLQVPPPENDTSAAAPPGAAAAAPTKPPAAAVGTDPPSSGSDAVDQAAAGAVKVYAEHTEPDYSQPWQRGRSHSSRSSGVMMQGPDGQPLVVTNAHSVEYATQVQVKRRADDRRYEARIVAVGRDCDLALLAVDDPAFWENATFARFGELPAIRDRMTVVGFPIGGEQLCSTRPAAAINPGNSGGPVFNDAGEVVGLAFQSLNGAEGIGYAVPYEIMAHFFEDVHLNGSFTGFPDLGLQLQRTESPALRAAYNMSEGQQGLLVRQVEPLGSCAGQVQEGDVLTKLKAPDLLVPVSLNGALPSYLMVGGLVVNVLSAPFMFSEYGSVGGSPTGLQDQLWFGVKNETDQQGRNSQIRIFNGRPVESLLQLAREVVTCDEPFMAFGVDHNEEVVLETAAVANATAEVMAVHAIPSFASKDIVEALAKEGLLKEAGI
ncbi:hypothetical protein COHA_000767 [Chlorella ohadii]|uniref:Protease Do-like PDZ domain-containing protein n=1 Tax=Chlorella ohadii TaxID=2649997 RepID=A0AAD5DZV1_9CHLO|nr:hypothetical protein COHA_000767 [Chlorella ohadii]